jgi:pyruvate kinase
MRRHRKPKIVATLEAKIVATLGPASSDEDTIRALFEAGADAFRFNFSHGAHQDYQARYDIFVRSSRKQGGRSRSLPICRVRRSGSASSPTGRSSWRPALDLDLDDKPGHQNRVGMPHPEIIQALKPGVELLARRMSLV